MLRVRVVLDTNILIGALITKGTPPDRLYRAWLRGEIELVTSAAQLAELGRRSRSSLVSKTFSTRMKRRRLSRISTPALLSLTTCRM